MSAASGALCVSSQVGRRHAQLHLLPYWHGKSSCAISTTTEIVGQVLAVKTISRNGPRAATTASFNIVFMGMGEPLYNLDNVVAAIDVISDGDGGFPISRRRITVSTSRRRRYPAPTAMMAAMLGDLAPRDETTASRRA
ncbi:MAG: hypothetical protein R3C54_09770 [Parvularculaceae bacterium]